MRGLADRFDERAQRLVDRLRALQDGAVPPDSSMNSVRFGAASAIRREAAIGSRRSCSLPITKVGTVRFCRPMWRGPIEFTIVLPQPPRPCAGVVAKRS